MKKINFQANTILNKKFATELAGYNATEVDAFFDLILEDYHSYEEWIKHLEHQSFEKTKLVNDKEAQITQLKLEIEALRDQLLKTGRATNVELLEEIRRLTKKIDANKDHSK